MRTLYIHLLGDFKLFYGDKPIDTLQQARLKSIFAYFLLHRGTPIPRQRLAFLYWPDATEKHAQNNLRKALFNLRTVLPDADTFLSADQKVIVWQSEAPITLDLAAFEDALQQAAQQVKSKEPSSAIQWWEKAATLYQGPFLPDCYEDWVLQERERLHQQCIDGLMQLIFWLEKEREYQKAILYAHQLLRLDPLHEATYSQLMRLYAVIGNRADALRLYHECVTVLQRELEVEPGDELQHLYQQLLKLEQKKENSPTPNERQSRAERMIGRHSEWDRLQKNWRTVRQGKPRVVLLAGEAGIGKSRLAEEFFLWLTHQGIHAARTRCYAAEGPLAYSPIIDCLRAEPLHKSLKQLSLLRLGELARLMPELLIEHPTLLPPEPLLDQWQRQRFFEALASALLAAGQPLLFLLDDLHWCDQETLEWLHFLFRFAPKAQLLVIGTMRLGEIGYDHPLMLLLHHLRSSDDLDEILLSPLSSEDTSALAAQIVGHSLDGPQAAAIFKESEGNPLFIVETMRATIGDGIKSDNRAKAGKAVDLPKIQAMIQLRLAQLSAPARNLALLASVIGRAFTLDLLAHVSGEEEDTLVRSLDELWQRRVIREQGANAYDFSHDRIRDVAYADVSPIRCRTFHRKVAQALEQVHQHELNTVGARVAAHYEAAGYPDKAVVFYYQAAQEAHKLAAFSDAVVYTTHALDLLMELPTSKDYLQQELALRTLLAALWTPIKGYSAAEVVELFERVAALCGQLDRSQQLFSALWGVHEAYLYRAEFAKAIAACERGLQIAEWTQQSDLLLQAYHAIWGTHFYCGDLHIALGYAQKGLAIYDFQQHKEQALEYGAHDPGVCSLQILGMSLFLLGSLDQAQQRFDDLARLLDRLTHPIAIADAALQLALYYVCLHNTHLTQHYVDLALNVCQKRGYVFYLAHAQVMKGWAITLEGNGGVGVPLMEQGLATWQRGGAQMLQIAFYTLMAEALNASAHFDQAMLALEAGERVTNACDDKFWKPELYRQKGNTFMALGEQQAAERAFLQAVEFAKKRDENTLALRATLNLARLWQQQNKQGEAYQLLNAIYASFHEGVENKDLQEAKQLLAELSSSRDRLWNA